MKLAKMARSVYYYTRKRMLREDKYSTERERIIMIFNDNEGLYGYRRVTAEMRNLGFKINHKTVLKIMREETLKVRTKKVKYHSYKGEVGTVAPNVLQRDFKASAPNQKWVTDVTQINIGSQKIYLSPIVDLFNGEIVSYNVSSSPNLAQVVEMIENAFGRFDRLDGLVIHSDQGWQYQHLIYRQLLEDRHVIQSMSRKGNCLDNAVAENFFGIMKTELLYSRQFKSAKDFITALHKYIDYYNNRRIKLRLRGMSPVQYRKQYLNILLLSNFLGAHHYRGTEIFRFHLTMDTLDLGCMIPAIRAH